MKELIDLITKVAYQILFWWVLVFVTFDILICP